ncbi:MAG: class I SAM-dependent methyltransferase [Methanomassiliicoccales archaeon]|jgi:ubiquinone/menaquinone biosynthesis C-methylase UbiE|nr:class I SAM-dependent methyltransferase [Methanomassiliicoccales archaeon]
MQSEQSRYWDEFYRKTKRAWKGLTELPVRLRGNERILELGCGDGKTLSALEYSGNCLVGVDFSSEALKICRKRFHMNERTDFLRAEASFLPFRNRSFDVVIAFHIFEHLRSNERSIVMSEVKRVLVPNGILLLRVFSTEDMRFGTGEGLDDSTFVKGTGVTVHYFDEGEILELLEGMEIRKMSKVEKEKAYGGRRVKRSYIEVVAENRASDESLNG